MSTFKEIIEYLDSIFPKSDSEQFDPDGIDICISPDEEIKKIVVALDVTKEISDYASCEGSNLIITHHPLIFNKISTIDSSNATGKRIISLISKGISSVSYHTRLDKHDGGVTDSLCECLGLKKEYRISNGLVNICSIEETDFESFSKKIESTLGVPLRCFNNSKVVKKIAVCGGGGKSFLDDVALEGADTYITGEVDHPRLIDAAEYGINLILGSHYATEALVLPFLQKTIKEGFPDIEVFIKYSSELSK